jgi:DNA-directed RNA polymerase subunit RPC12/RpoP
MPLAIAIRCLQCGHRAAIAESELPDYGFKSDTPLALLSKRFKCGECGSRASIAKRFDTGRAA